MEAIVSSLGKTLLPTSLYERLAVSSLAKRLARGSLWSIFGSATSRVLLLLAMVLVARVLGQVAFGEFGLIQATLGVAGLMAGMGLGGTATRFVAQYAKTDPARAGRVIALVNAGSIASVVLASGVLIAASAFIARSLFEAPHLQIAFIWGALLMGATAFRGIQNGVFAGLEKFDVIAKLNIIEGVVLFVSVVILAQILGVEGAVFGLALGTAVMWASGHFLLMAELRGRGITIRYQGCWRDRRILTDYSLPSFLAHSVATPVLWFAMTQLARVEDGFAQLGVYNAAYQWHGPMVFIPMILMSVSIPVLVQEWEAGRRARFRAVTFWLCGLMFSMSLPPILLASTLSPWIMSLYGSGFREGWLVLVLLLAAAPLHATAKIASGALFGMNRAWWVLSVNMAWGVALLTLAVWLIPVLGAIGLAIAFLIAYAILATLSFGLVVAGSRLLPAGKLIPCKANQGRASR